MHGMRWGRGAIGGGVCASCLLCVLLLFAFCDYICSSCLLLPIGYLSAEGDVLSTMQFECKLPRHIALGLLYSTSSHTHNNNNVIKEINKQLLHYHHQLYDISISEHHHYHSLRTYFSFVDWVCFSSPLSLTFYRSDLSMGEFGGWVGFQLLVVHYFYGVYMHMGFYGHSLSVTTILGCKWGI